MKTRRILAATLLVALTVGTSAQHPTVDAVFDAFFAAASPAAAAQLIDSTIQAGTAFDDAYRRLQRGRTYGPQPSGVVRLMNRTAAGEHFYTVNIPETYDPAHRYQVRIQLHGGVSGRRTNAPVGPGTIGALAGAEQIYILPYAWDESPWWSDDQVMNLVGIIDAVKRLYNVDENRVVLSGVSDGGTGAYYVAMHETTPFASFLPLNGYLMVLALQDIDDGHLFANNLRNKPLFIVNGGRDPLYPTRVVDPYIEHMKRGGVMLSYNPQPTAAHNTAWWPDVKDAYEAFVREHPRAPLPDTLTWETGDNILHHRAHWLIIDRLGALPAEAKGLADLNEQAVPPAADFGARSVGTRVNRVMPGSSAERIGLKAGDVLVRLNDQPVPGGENIADALEDIKPGTYIELLVARDNLPVELSGTYEPKMVQSPPRALFSRGGPTGRVDLTRVGNTVTAATRGVQAFTLLLSPDQFDFGKPVKVIANGRTVFDGRVQKNQGTLLKWAAADNDRTMLFGAELHIVLAPTPAKK